MRTIPYKHQGYFSTLFVYGEASYFHMMGRNARSWANPWRLESDGRHMVSDRYNYLYSDEELEELILFIVNVRNSTKTIFVVFDNDPNANSLYNGFRLRHLLTPKKKLLLPQTMIKTFPALKQISSSVNVYHPLFAELPS